MLLHGYCKLLRAFPMRTKSATSALTFAATDAIAQTREISDKHTHSTKKWDAKSTLVSAAFGALWLGPTNHLAWNTLEKIAPGSSWKNVFKRVAIDQVTVMPLNMCIFLSWRPAAAAVEVS